MLWTLLVSLNFELHQIGFQTKELCEKAKDQLIAENNIPRTALACVQISEIDLNLLYR
jgi:hypothetical protein